MKKLMVNVMMLAFAASPLFAFVPWCHQGVKITVRQGTLTMSSIAGIPTVDSWGNPMSNIQRASVIADLHRDNYLASHPGANVMVKVTAAVIPDPLHPGCYTFSPTGPWTYKVIRCYPPGTIPPYEAHDRLEDAIVQIEDVAGGLGVGVHADEHALQEYSVDGRDFVIYSASLKDVKGRDFGSVEVDLNTGKLTYIEPESANRK